MKLMRWTAVGLVAAATVATAAAPPRTLTPDDVLDEVKVDAPAVSPDGRLVAYGVSRWDRKERRRDGDIFVVPFGGGPPRRLTAVPGVESDYAWSPDSRLLAFAARRDGSKSQIYVIDVSGGEARRLTDLPSGASGPQWSPDGKTIAFYAPVGERYTPAEKEAFGDVRYVTHLRFYHLGRGWDDGSRQRIFVMPAQGGEPRQLTDGACSDEGDAEMAWRPDSREIAFVSNRSPEWWNTIDTNLYAVNVSSGETRQLTSNPGPDHAPAWSPDGRLLAYRASFEYNYESENYKILVMPASGGDPRVLTAALDRSVHELAWDRDGRRIHFTASSEGSTNLMWVSLDAPDVIHDTTTGRNTVRSWSVAAGGFVMLRSTDVDPEEVYALDGAGLRRLSGAATAFWSAFTIAPAEEVRVTAADGARLQGWLVRPPGASPDARLPLVLAIHGGPHGMYSPTLRFQVQLLAGRGYAVLFANPRGSDGYGQAFADAIHGDWHTLPFADLMAFVDHAVAMGVADAKKLGVMGGSYGGWMTNWIIGHTDRFAAAVSVAGLSNMVSFYGTTDEQFFPEKEMGGAPWRNQETYRSNSPLWAAEAFSTPTMVIHGDDDWRVRPEQGEQLFVALQKMGVPSVFVDFPEEQHGVRQPVHLVLYHRLLTEWFDHWLQGRPVELATFRERGGQ